MNDSQKQAGRDDQARRDEILRRLLKTPPQPRPKRERDNKPKPAKSQDKNGKPTK